MLQYRANMLHNDSLGAPRTARCFHPLRLSLILATTLTVRFAAAQAKPADATWVPYESKAGGFSVSMPGPSAESKVATPLRSVSVDLASKQGTLPSGGPFICSASVTFLPVSLETRANAAHHLDSILKSHVGQDKSQKANETDLSVQGLPARRTERIVQKGAARLKQKTLAVFTGNRILFSISIQTQGIRVASPIASSIRSRSAIRGT